VRRPLQGPGGGGHAASTPGRTVRGRDSSVGSSPTRATSETGLWSRGAEAGTGKTAVTSRAAWAAGGAYGCVKPAVSAMKGGGGVGGWIAQPGPGPAARGPGATLAERASGGANDGLDAVGLDGVGIVGVGFGTVDGGRDGMDGVGTVDVGTVDVGRDGSGWRPSRPGRIGGAGAGWPAGAPIGGGAGGTGIRLGRGSPPAQLGAAGSEGRGTSERAKIPAAR
jgi:hypothetical protein